MKILGFVFYLGTMRMQDLSEFLSGLLVQALYHYEVGNQEKSHTLLHLALSYLEKRSALQADWN